MRGFARTIASKNLQAKHFKAYVICGGKILNLFFSNHILKVG
jgi:hypothetical protein